jgi:predicted Zn-dependent protease
MVTMVYGYSRELEAEADHRAVDRLTQAGRDPRQMIRMFAILDDKLEPVPVPRFFNDHPKTKDRIAYLKKSLGVSEDIGPAIDKSYTERMRPAIVQNIQLDLDGRLFRSAVAGAERLAAAYPNDAQALYRLGESYLSLGPRRTRLTEAELTDAALRRNYGRTRKLTEDEDTKALAALPEGRAEMEANWRKAEEAFQKAAALDPSLPEPQFGLGSLYQQMGKAELAIAAYRRSAELSTKPAERQRAERRIAELAKRQQSQSQGESK